MGDAFKHIYIYERADLLWTRDVALRRSGTSADAPISFEEGYLTQAVSRSAQLPRLLQVTPHRAEM